MALFFGLAFAALLVAAIVNAISRRPVLNGGRVGGVSILVLMGVAIAVAIPDPDAGRRVGGVIGQALLPLLLCVWLDRRHAVNVHRRSQTAA